MCFRSDSDCVYSQSSFQASSRVGMRFPPKNKQFTAWAVTRDSCPEEGRGGGAAACAPEGQRSRAAGVESPSVSAFLEGRRTKKVGASAKGGKGGAAPKSSFRKRDA